MANPAHLEILKQGVEAWNQWIAKNPEIGIDLRGAKLKGLNLSGINLSGALLSQADLRDVEFIGANLSAAELSGANLSRANLQQADLKDTDFNGGVLGSAYVVDAKMFAAVLYRTRLDNANLCQANLAYADLREASLRTATMRHADLRYTDLTNAELRSADLTNTKLTSANLTKANLSNVILSGANLEFVNLTGARISSADFTSASMGGAVLATNDFCNARGLNTVFHKSPSALGTDTIALSKGRLPQIFLRGCGLSDWEIEAAKLYNPELSNQEVTDSLYRIHDLRAHQALQISPLFISYSHSDGGFVDELEKLLNAKGIRFWRDIHQATAGRLETQVDRAMRLNPTVLLILSAASIESDWVQHEVRLARELAKEIKRDVLCPIALDESWKSCQWPQRLLEQVKEYNILDFSRWREEHFLQHTFSKLTDGLNLYYNER